MLIIIMTAMIAALLITVLAAQLSLVVWSCLVSQVCRLAHDTETFPKQAGDVYVKLEPMRVHN